MTVEQKDSETIVREWGKLIKGNAERDLVQAVFASFLSASPILDRFSVWLLAGTGATTALIIANLDKLFTVLEPDGLQWSIAILLVSVLVGLLAKFRAIRIHIFASLREEMEKRLGSVLDEHDAQQEQVATRASECCINVETDIDMSFVVQELCRAFPWFWRKRAKKNFEAGMKDPLLQFRRATYDLYWQSLYVIVQLLSLVGFGAIAGMSIRDKL